MIPAGAKATMNTSHHTDEATPILGRSSDGKKHSNTSRSLVVILACVSFGVGAACMYWAMWYETSIGITMTRPSRYSRFQGLGFQIYTGGAPAFLRTTDESGRNTTAHNPECYKSKSYGHADGDIQCYLGLRDATKDVQKRLDIMKAAVERAYELADPNPETLKIFLAPEFYFRGRNGAYAFESDAEEQAKGDGSCGTVCTILRGLENIVEDERFEDWLFLFGTVVASETLPTQDPFDYLFYNFAPLYKGGIPSQRGGKRFLVPKRFVSNMDFLTPSRSFNTSMTMELIDDGVPIDADEVTDAVLNPYEWKHTHYDNSMWAQYKDELRDLSYEMIEYGWFLIDGICFSVEICVDHDARRALTTYLANAASFAETYIPSGDNGGVNFVEIPSHQAQISLVSSAGMSVNIDSLALADNGTILLQDGLEDEPSHYEWISKRKHQVEYGGGSEAVQRRSVLTATDVFFEYKLNEAYDIYPIFPEDSAWKQELEGVFTKAKYPPKLTVYQPEDITQVG